jgi:tRNA threonylcarbamoyladenosine biosynthesis protein TsaE
LEVTYDLNNIQQAAGKLLRTAGNENVWAFYGSMGAGKTTLIRALGKKLGIVDQMNSPTFALVNEYADLHGNPVYHFDCYRINNEEEALDAGITEYFYSGNLCLVEWPEKIANLLPDSFLQVQLEILTPDTRKLETRRI